MYVIGFKEVFHLLDGKGPALLKWSKYAVYLILIAAAIYRAVDLEEIHHKPTSPYQEAQSESFDYMKELVTRDTLVAAGPSYILSVKTGCRSLRLPSRPEDLLKIDAEYIEIDYILISRWSYKIFPAYHEFIESDAFKSRYKLLEEFTNKSKLYVKTALHDPVK
jgi:hypothetical protein